MKLDALYLKSFRCFDEINITFHPKLTVLVAINGAGKTSILDAIRIALWPYVSSFDLANEHSKKSTYSIQLDDVTEHRSNENGEVFRLLPTIIKASGKIGNVTDWELRREAEGKNSRTIENANTKRIREWAKRVQDEIRSRDEQRLGLPVIGYYGTGRLWSNDGTGTEKKLTNAEHTNTNIRTFGYVSCLNPDTNYRTFSAEFKKLMTSKLIEVMTAVGKEDSFEAQFNNDYAGFTSSVLNLNTLSSKKIAAITKAVNIFLSETSFQGIYFDVVSNSVTLTDTKQSIQLKIGQLSDGIRNTVGMVADIAYRCIQLNPHLEPNDALLSDGIIMIDEIDMHLHPQWQQLILGQLSSAFPNVQFIVTTHSPQVITTVPDECIRILNDSQVNSAPKGTQGAESSRVLKTVFLTDERPKNNKFTKDLKAYLDLVYADQWLSDDKDKREVVADLRKKLEVNYENEEPALTEADLYIENRRWELGLEENQ